MSSKVWVSDPSEVFLEGTLLSQTDRESTVQIGSEICVFANGIVFPAQKLGYEGIADMVALQQLNEASILANLNFRFVGDRIYTYTGSILISVNPYRTIPIYSDSVVKMYRTKPLGAAPPHIFAIADCAYQSMNTEFKNQSIMISGESGAGKTEAIKLILNYLTQVSFRSGSNKESKGKIDGHSRTRTISINSFPIAAPTIKKNGPTPQQQVLASSPILEAFGNAKTLNNHNSSRFSKLCEVQFDSTGFLVGASIKCYMLEKTRVTFQNPNERNYHIFYYISAGADKTEREHWKLKSADEYTYTNRSGCIVVPQLESKVEYGNLKRALSTAGVFPPEQHLIFTVIASILHLGNVHFHSAVGDSSFSNKFVSDSNTLASDADCAKLDNIGTLELVASLLECDVNKLSAGLLTRENVINNEIFTVPLTVSQALDSRDSLARLLYDKQFEWIVNRVNISKSDTFNHSISLLDIFGFEVFQHNSFEQFCINFCNEVLQYHFNQHIFKAEKEAYIQDGISLSDFQFSDNQITIDLIAKKPVGILLLMDEEARFPRGTDETFLAKVLQQHGKHPSLIRDKFSPSDFKIVHYAAEVNYDVKSFLFKNRQTVNSLLVKAVKGSSCKHISNLLSSFDDNTVNIKTTQSAQFRDQLFELMDRLGKTNPHFIRCIRPNDAQKPLTFDKSSVIRQLRYSGIVDTVKIRQGGFPNRRELGSFLERYSMLCKVSTAAAFCQSMKIESENYRIGHSMIFLKDALFHHLEGLRNAFYNRKATVIQAIFRSFRMKKRYLLKKSATLHLQHWLRTFLSASDCSDTVKECLSILHGAGAFTEKRDALVKLESLCFRDKNVDTMSTMGVIPAILSSVESFLEDSSEKNDNYISAAAIALNSIASVNEENSCFVARAGAIPVLMKCVKSFEGKPCIADIVMLLDTLSQNEKNMEMIVREGVVATLTKVLQLCTTTNDASNIVTSRSSMQFSSRENAYVSKPKDSSSLLDMCSRALATMTSNSRVSRLVGRDITCLSTVYRAMDKNSGNLQLIGNSLQTLGNLCQHKNNLDMLIEMKSIPVIVEMMRKHPSRDKIYSDASRALLAISAKPENLKLIYDEGVLELLLIFIANNNASSCPEEVFALTQALCSSTILSLNSAEELIESYLKTFLGLLKSFPNGNSIDCIMEILRLCSAKSELAIKMLEIGAADVFVAKLKTLSNEVNCAISTIGLLHNLATVDYETINFLKSNGCVGLIAMVMEHQEANSPLCVAGAALLKLLADNNDLSSAMDSVGRSQLEEQSRERKFATKTALAISRNMALIDSNVDYMVQEGGLPVLLSLINGSSAEAIDDADVEANVSSALCAIARMLKTSTLGEFLIEGGIQTLVAVLKTHSSQEVILSSGALLFDVLAKDPRSVQYLIDNNVVPAILGILRDHPEYSFFSSKSVGLLSLFAQNLADGSSVIMGQSDITPTVISLLQSCPDDPELAANCCDLLTKLSTNSSVATKLCKDLASNVVAISRKCTSSVQLAVSVCNLFSSWITQSTDNLALLRSLNATEVVAGFLETAGQENSQNLLDAATPILVSLAGEQEIIRVVENIKIYSQELSADPTNMDIMKKLSIPLSMFGNLASSVSDKVFLVQNDGIGALSAVISSIIISKECIAHERVFELTAVAIQRLCVSAENSAVICKNGTLAKLLEAIMAHPEYELASQYVQKIISHIAAQQENVDLLLGLPIIEAISSIATYHPLNDEIHKLSGSALSSMNMTKDQARHVLQRGAGKMLVEAINVLLPSEEPLVHALEALGKVASVAGYSGFVVENNGISYLLNAFKAHSESAGVGTAYLECIARLCEDHSFRDAFVTAGGLNTIAAGLRNSGRDSSFCVSAINLMTVLASKKYLDMLNDARIPEFIAECMESMPDDFVLQIAGLDCLSRFAKVSKYSERFGEDSLIEQNMSILQAHSVHPTVVISSLSFLSQLACEASNVDKFLTSGAVDVIEFALTEYTSNSYIQEVGSKLMAKLGREWFATPSFAPPPAPGKRPGRLRNNSNFEATAADIPKNLLFPAPMFSVKTLTEIFENISRSTQYKSFSAQSKKFKDNMPDYIMCAYSSDIDSLINLQFVENVTAVAPVVSNSKLVLETVAFLTKMANNVERTVAVLSRGGASYLLDALKSFDNSPVEKLQVLLSISHIVDIGNSSEFALEGDYIEVLLNTLVNSDDSMILAATLQALARLSEDSDAASKFVGIGGLPVVAAVLKNNFEHQAIVTYAACLFDELSSVSLIIPKMLEITIPALLLPILNRWENREPVPPTLSCLNKLAPKVTKDDAPEMPVFTAPAPPAVSNIPVRPQKLGKNAWNPNMNRIDAPAKNIGIPCTNVKSLAALFEALNKTTEADTAIQKTQKYHDKMDQLTVFAGIQDLDSLLSLQMIETICSSASIYSIKAENHSAKDWYNSAIGVMEIFTDTAAHANAVLTRGGCAFLLDSMLELQSETALLIDCLRAFANLVQLSSNATVVLENDGVKTLLASLRNNRDNAVIITAVLQCLARLTEDGEFADSFVTLGGLSDILDMLLRYSDEEGINTYGTAILENISCVETLIPALINSKVGSLCLAILNRWGENNKNIKLSATNCLSKLAPPPSSLPPPPPISAKGLLPEGTSEAGPRRPGKLSKNAFNPTINKTAMPKNYGIPPGKVGDLTKIFNSLFHSKDLVEAVKKSPRYKDEYNIHTVVAMMDVDDLFACRVVEAVVGSAMFSSSNAKLSAENTAIHLASVNLLAFMSDSVAHANAILTSAGKWLLESLVGLDEVSSLEALAALTRILEVCDDMSFFSSGGGLELLLDLFVAHMNNPLYCAVMAQIFALVCRDVECAKLFVEKGALAHFKKAMKLHPDDVAFAVYCMCLFENLSRVQVNVEPMRIMEITSVIVDVLVHFNPHALVQTPGLNALSNMVFWSKPVGLECGKNGSIEAALDAIQTHYTDEIVVIAALKFLAQLATYPENLDSLIAAGALPIIEWALSQFPNNESIQEFGKHLVSLLSGNVTLLECDWDSLDSWFLGDKGIDDIEFSLELLKRAVAIILASEKEDQPQLFKAVKVLGRMKATPEILDVLTDLKVIPGLVKVLNRHKKDPLYVTAICRGLDKFAIANESNINQIVSAGGVGTLLKAIKECMDDPDALCAAIALLGHLATNDHLKTLIGLQGGIKLIFEAMRRYPGHQELLEKCCYALANLAYHNAPNMSSIVQTGCIEHVINAMLLYPLNVELQASASICLSNLCHNSDSNKALIGKLGGIRAIVTMMRFNATSVRLLKLGCKALGNLAKGVDNISAILKEGAVSAIVSGMSSNSDNAELLLDAIGVLANLSADAAGVDDINAMQRIAVEEKGAVAVVNAARRHVANTAMQMVCLGTLGNFCSVQVIALEVVRCGGAKAVVDALASSKTQDLLLMCLQVLALMSCDEASATLMGPSGCVGSVISILKSNLKNNDIVASSLAALSRLMISREMSIEAVDKNIVSVILHLFSLYSADDKMLVEILRLLSNLVNVEDNAYVVSDDCLQIILPTLTSHCTNQVYMRACSIFLCGISVFSGPSRKMMQIGMIPAICKTLKANKEYPLLLSKLVRTLGNICVSDAAARDRLEDEDASLIVKDLQAIHYENAAFMKAAEFFLKKMSEHVFGKQILIDQIPIRDHFEKHLRNALLGGTIFTKHCYTAAPRQRLLKVSAEFDALIMDDPQKNKEPHRMPISSIREVCAGACTPQLQRKMFGHTQAVPEKSFAIFFRAADDYPVSLEATNQQEASKWINAIVQLIKYNPKR